MKNNTLKNLLSVSAVLLVFAFLLSFATALLQPKYMTDLEEGKIESAEITEDSIMYTLKKEEGEEEKSLLYELYFGHLH